jgi:hypothetical protein
MSNESTAPQRAPGEILNTKLGEQLTVAKRLARGRLSVVYAGVHPVLARRFAVKVLSPGLTRDENIQWRLRRTIREASTVEHPNVASLVDFGQTADGRFYVVMDFVRGTQLTKALTQDGRFTVPRAVPLLIQLAEALEAAHRLRVVHGDVKPNNMLLVEQPSGEIMLKLHDFAITMALSGQPTEEDPLGHLRVYGSMDYLSPEQINNARVDGRADIYAYGAVAYRMLAGEPPFVGSTEEGMIGHRTREPVPPSRRVGAHEVPPELDAIVLRCLEKNPADRFKSMQEVAHELRALAPKAALGPLEEEITGRWKLPPEAEEAEEPLPESPAKLRQLFYDTMLALGELAVTGGTASAELQEEIRALTAVKEQATGVGGQAAVVENRFEDIRRQLREQESTLRYAIIDLNLAKSDTKEPKSEEALREMEAKIADLERQLAELAQQRSERFAALNEELMKSRESLKGLEQQLAVHYRRLYAQLDEARAELGGDDARQLYRLLERCRAALAKPAAAAGVNTAA